MSRRPQGDLIGKTFFSAKFGEYEIVDYQNFNNVTVKFAKTGFTTKATMNAVNKGGVKDKLSPSVYGVGIVSDKYKTRDDSNMQIKEYRLWNRMLERCYSKKFQDKNPSYKNCEASINFKQFTFFKEWCEKQLGFNQGWELDKDLLTQGNLIYSEKTCVFLPEEINRVITKRKVSGKVKHTGVVVNSRTKKIEARISMYNKDKTIGVFNSIDEASRAFKLAKKAYLKELADKWKGKIDYRAYEALLNFEL